jgi:hypothetical protein
MSDRRLQDAARAIRRHAIDVHHTHARSPHYAQVTSVSPLAATLEGTLVNLSEADDSIVVTTWVRRYDSDVGLVVGDTLVVTLMRDGHWLAHDVIAQ